MPGKLAGKTFSRGGTVSDFLLPASDMKGLFVDEELVYSARCSLLCSCEGWGADPTYRALHQDFDRPLREF